MYKVKLLKVSGMLGKVGDIVELSNSSADYWQRKGHIKIVKYLGKVSDSPYYLKQQIVSFKNQIKALEDKINFYEGKIRIQQRKVK